ncbi:MAG: hypothetical protein ACI4B3_04285 [Prevotella sp.]
MTNTIRNIEDVLLKKEELRNEIDKRSDIIANLWGELTTVKKSDDKGEFIANVISKGIMTFDAVMVISKLYRRYGNIFSKKKRRR